MAWNGFILQAARSPYCISSCGRAVAHMYVVSHLFGLSIYALLIRVYRAVQTFTQTLSESLLSTTMLGDSLSPWSVHDSNKAIYECLSTATPHRPALPAELILQILDHPSRWLCSKQTLDEPTPDNRLSPILISANNGGQPKINVILSTPPVAGEELAHIRRLVFTFESKDQGWSGYPRDHGTYSNTWSWFEAGVRPEGKSTTYTGTTSKTNDDAYKRFHLQRNRHAGQNIESYRIELGQDHKLIRDLGPGDAIDLLACAQYPGWQNQVHSASIEIWSYDDPTKPDAP